MAAVLCLAASQGRAAALHVEGGVYTAWATPLSVRMVPLPAGFLHTDGARIVGPDGAEARLLAVKWYGLASPALSPAGLTDHNDRELLATIRRLGFNVIRLPFCDALFDASKRPRAIAARLNPELVGPDGAPLPGLALLDRLVAHAGEAGLKIILDHHSSAPGDGPNTNGLWYDPDYRYEAEGQPQDAANWTRNWLMLARHFAANRTIIGADLANEPHGMARWGGGGRAD
jgi:aryl-phospho-beta-D-glucosidase BglC (GH1 family)